MHSHLRADDGLVATMERSTGLRDDGGATKADDGSYWRIAG